MKFESVALTDIGLVREQNQDAIMESPGQGVFLVADGMGGEKAGEEASAQVVLTVQESLNAFFSAPPLNPAQLIEYMRDTLLQANMDVLQIAVREPGKRGLGSTASLMCLHRGVCLLYERGVITREQIETHPERHLLTQCIGSRRPVNVDLMEQAVHPGDLFLICSDGLSGMIGAEDIRRCLADTQSGVEVIGDTLIQQALKAGGGDNVSTVLVRVTELEPDDDWTPDELENLQNFEVTKEETIASEETTKPVRRATWVGIGAPLILLLLFIAAFALLKSGDDGAKPAPDTTATLEVHLPGTIALQRLEVGSYLDGKEVDAPIIFNQAELAGKSMLKIPVQPDIHQIVRVRAPGREDFVTSRELGIGDTAITSLTKAACLAAFIVLASMTARTGLAIGEDAPTGPLTAREVAVVANSSFPGSIELAQYYMQKRGIPQDQLLRTTMPTGETVERQIYERQIATPLRDFLVQEHLDQVRCVVLMYGVPLKVAEPRQTPQDKLLERMILDDREAWLKEMDEACRQARTLGATHSADEATPVPIDANALASPEADRLGKALLEDMRQAAGRIAALPDGPARDQAAETWRALWSRNFGFDSPAGRGLNAAPDMPQTSGQRRAGYARRLNELMLLPLAAESVREFLDLARESRGTAMALRISERMLRRVHPDWQSRASVDSELCTLFWPDFPLDRWVINPLNSDVNQPDAPRTLMVCRLDGPGEVVVRRMIDDSLATEAAGLHGRIYLDSRGYGSAHDAYGRYDMDIQALGRSLDEQTTLSVTLERTGELFQPGDCPDAALYCGWYKLAHYVDAFDFNRGAIAWHIASSEAVSLRKPGSTLWCPSLLADGAAATLGPVEEPYLTAFPLPSRFFGRVLAGQDTLAECYFKTVPSLSWMMTLIGDPLYRPYAADPVKLK